MQNLVSGEPWRVLLISSSAELHEKLGEAFAAGASEHRYFWVSQRDLALVRAQGLAPHVILVDGDLEGVTGLVRQLSTEVTQAAVLVLVPGGSQGLLLARDTMLAGARAFIPQPVQADDLLATIRQVLGHRPAAPPLGEYTSATGRVIVFCGPKGGTGRTTLAINTAVSLTHIVRDPVVLVDADYAAPAIDVALNLRGQRDIRDLVPKLNQLDADLVSGVLATHSSGVQVLLAPPPDATEAPPTLPQVQQVTAWLKRMFPWVLVDLGLPLDEAAYAFLDAADRAVVSILPEMVGIRNAKLMLAQFAERQYPAGKVWPLLNREGLWGSIPTAEVERYLGKPMRFRVPNDQELATETINRGVPMVISHRHRPLARAYHRLAQELVHDRKLEAAAVVEPAGPAAAGPATGDVSAAASPGAATTSAIARLRGRIADFVARSGIASRLVRSLRQARGPASARRR